LEDQSCRIWTVKGRGQTAPLLYQYLGVTCCCRDYRKYLWL